MIGQAHTPSYSGSIDDIGIYLCSMEQSIDTRKHKEESSARDRKNIVSKSKQSRKPQVKKSFGRWRYREHFVYMEALRAGLNQKDMFKYLESELPSRSSTQIRAHHQKMVYKFEGVDNILRAYSDRDHAAELMKMSDILDLALGITNRVSESITNVLSAPTYYKKKN